MAATLLPILVNQPTKRIVAWSNLRIDIGQYIFHSPIWGESVGQGQTGLCLSSASFFAASSLAAPGRFDCDPPQADDRDLISDIPPKAGTTNQTRAAHRAQLTVSSIPDGSMLFFKVFRQQAVGLQQAFAS